MVRSAPRSSSLNYLKLEVLSKFISAPFLRKSLHRLLAGMGGSASHTGKGIGLPSTGVLTLHNFNVRARGEPPHLCAAYLGIPLADNFISDYGVVMRMPRGVVPVLQLEDDTLVPETDEICKCIVKMKSPLGHSLVDDDTQQQVHNIGNGPLSWSRMDPMSAAHIVNMVPWNSPSGKGSVPQCLQQAAPHFATLEAKLAGARGPFFSGAAVGWGDLSLFAVLDVYTSISPTALDATPNLKTFCASCAALPGIAPYLSTGRPKLGTRGFGRHPQSLMAVGFGADDKDHKDTIWA